VNNISYNEIIGENGRKRPAFKSLESRNKINLTDLPSKILPILKSKNRLTASEIYPVPLVLDETEYQDVLVPGVVQRAIVLQNLFADIAFGSERIIESGLLRKEELNYILSYEGIDIQTLRRLWKGQSPDQIRFIYGPDLVRDPTGQWLVLEDNIGCIGGVADGEFVLGKYIRASNISLNPTSQENSLLQSALEMFLERVGLLAQNKWVFGIPDNESCSYSEFQYESAWKSNLLQSLGFPVIRVEELLKGIAENSIHPRAIINLATTLSVEYRQLAEKIFAGFDLPVFGSPEVELVASKIFHALSDDLVSLYTNDVPILAIPPTELQRDIPLQIPNSGVLKRTNGRSGNEVFFLQDLKESARKLMLDKLNEWGPCGAVIQEQINRSMIKDAFDFDVFTEIRPIVYVYGWGTAMVDSFISGRAVPIHGQQLGNVSRGAMHLPIIREIVSGKT
jgi:hypothetical protein